MALFVPDRAIFGDPVGWGYWRVHHADEHTQFNNMLGIAGIDVLSWRQDPDFVKQWLNDHYTRLHLPLRKLTGVSGEDLSSVDFTDEDSWYDWIDIHSNEHADLRDALGIV
jgi:hypothetical protein